METSDDFHMLIILGRNPQAWSAEDVSTVCQAFKDSCDDMQSPVNPDIVTQLWHYWLWTHGERPLFREPHYNMALMLNAQALGEFTPSPDSSSFFGRFRREHANFEQTHTPSLLNWGPKAMLNTRSGPMLESPIVHTFVLRRDKEIEEILIMGHPPVELQQALFQAVFSCQLRIGGANLNGINADFYRILAADNRQELLDIPGITAAGSSAIDTQEAAAALQGLVHQLQAWQQQTELVVVHECAIDDKRTFESQVRQYARQADRHRQAILVAKEPETSPEITDLMTTVPYYRFGRRPLPIQITFHPDMLTSPAFAELLETFTTHTVEKIRLDATVRRETYQKWAAQLQKEQKLWQTANEVTRRAMSKEMMRLTEIFNNKTGTSIRLAEPKEVPRADWVKNTVPRLIAQYQGWAGRMQTVIDDIQKAAAQPDAPIRRLAAGRFLDAVLRGRVEMIAPTMRPHLVRWAEQVGPYLRCRWQNALTKWGLPPETIFNRHTIFHTHFATNKQNQVVALVMQPFAIISPAHTVLLFDPGKKALSVHTPADAGHVATEYRPSDFASTWQSLKKPLSESIRSQEALNIELRSLLAEFPTELLPLLVDYLTKTKKDDGEPAGTSQDWAARVYNLLSRQRLINFPFKIVTLFNQRAFHSARKLIQETALPAQLQVRLTLWRLLIECAAGEENPNTLIPRLAQSPGLAANIYTQLLHQARQQDASFVTEWVELLKNNENLQPAVRLLHRDWVRLERADPEQALLRKAETAVSSVFLARMLETAAQAITADGESTAEVLLKIGQSLNDLLLTDLGYVPYGDVIGLLEILSGAEAPRDY